MAIDFDSAAATLRELFEEIQQRILQGTALPIADDVAPAFETIFATPIQSYPGGIARHRRCAAARPDHQSSAALM
jgi:glutathione S-transferase